MAEPTKTVNADGSSNPAVSNIVKFTSSTDTTGDLLNFTFNYEQNEVILSRSKYVVLENFAEYSIDTLTLNGYQLDGFSYNIKPTTLNAFLNVTFTGTSTTTFQDNFLYAILVEEDANASYEVDGTVYKHYSAKVIGEFSRTEMMKVYFLQKKMQTLKD